MARTKRELPAGLTEETLDASVAGVRTQDEFDVLFRGLKQAITERILRAELTEHLGYPEGEPRPAATTNARNGTTPKTLVTESGAVPLEAASKLLYLALRNAVVKLGAPKDWKIAMQHITLVFGDRVPMSE